MIENIATKALTIAKEKERRGFGYIEKRILEFMQKRFAECLEAKKDWEKDIIQDKALCTNIYFEQVTKKMGFDISVADLEYAYHISIPEYEVGAEKTQAQLMLEEFKTELHPIIEGEKKKAKEKYEVLVQKISQGKFEAKRVSEKKWEITIKEKILETNDFYWNELKILFQKVGFDDVIHESTFSIRFILTEKD